MDSGRLTLSVLPDLYAVCRLPAGDPWPGWPSGEGIVSITRTGEELSVACPQSRVPADVQAQQDWRCLKVAGPLDFGLTGVLAALTAPLADAAIPIFAVSTYDTDYLLLKDADLQRALAALTQAGHVITGY